MSFLSYFDLTKMLIFANYPNGISYISKIPLSLSKKQSLKEMLDISTLSAHRQLGNNGYYPKANVELHSFTFVAFLQGVIFGVTTQLIFYECNEDILFNCVPLSQVIISLHAYFKNVNPPFNQIIIF